MFLYLAGSGQPTVHGPHRGALYEGAGRLFPLPQCKVNAALTSFSFCDHKLVCCVFVVSLHSPTNFKCNLSLLHGNDKVFQGYFFFVLKLNLKCDMTTPPFTLC